jgi:hypothetical protein
MSTQLDDQEFNVELFCKKIDLQNVCENLQKNTDVQSYKFDQLFSPKDRAMIREYVKRFSDLVVHAEFIPGITDNFAKVTIRKTEISEPTDASESIPKIGLTATQFNFLDKYGDMSWPNVELSTILHCLEKMSKYYNMSQYYIFLNDIKRKTFPVLNLEYFRAMDLCIEFIYSQTKSTIDKLRSQKRSDKYVTKSSKFYSSNNVGELFVTIDIKSANYTCLQKYMSHVPQFKLNWPKFVETVGQTDSEFIQNCKKLRQIIFSKANADIFTSMAYTLLMEIESAILGTIFESCIKKYECNTDELIFEVINEELFDFDTFVDCIKKLDPELQKYKIEYLRFGKFEPYPYFCKSIIKSTKPNFIPMQFKCIPKDHIAQIINFIEEKPNTEKDMIFIKDNIRCLMLDSLCITKLNFDKKD